MSIAPQPTRTHARFAGLDGLRAVAVILVVVYHVFPGWIARSGFIGVDMFFVISGFLITSLLLREHTATGGIRLLDFWRRRARRLLPALAVVVTVTATWALLVGGDVLVRLGWQVLGAGTFSYNWVSVAGHSSYFSADTPELLRNIWSLAVEEQFYWVWPLLLPLFLLIPRLRWRVGAAAGAAVLSAAGMAVVVGTGGDLTLAYFGTDTHAFGLLLGVALAVALQRMYAEPPAWLFTPRIRHVGTGVGAAAVAGLCITAMLPEGDSVLTFPGTLLLASILAGVAVVTATAPGSVLGPALDWAPLRWIGDRSYGIYLWHWPLFVLLAAMTGRNAAADNVPMWVGMLTIALTIAAAALSFRFIEQPVRHNGFRASARAFGALLRGTPAARRRAAVALAMGVVVVTGTTAAIATAPAQSSGQRAVAAGAAALREEAASTAHRTSTEDASVRAVVDAAAPITGSQIDAIGDSVMLAAAPALMQEYPGIRIDAEVSRQMWDAPDVLAQMAAKGELRPYIVIGLGTNGTVRVSDLNRVRRIIGPARQLVLVEASAPRPWIAGVNRTLTAYAAAHTDVYTANWPAAIAPHRNLLAGDDIHPGAAGGRIYAATVGATITDAHLYTSTWRVMSRRAALLTAPSGRSRRP